MVEGAEECDDDNDDPNDGCTNFCTLCGNLNITAPETCDDGNNDVNDDCPEDCQIGQCTPTASPVLLERLGDTGFVRMLAWHDRIVRETAEQHSGFVVKSEGDGFMRPAVDRRSAIRRPSRAAS